MADALLGILIEDVDTGGIDRNGDPVACLSLGARGNSCDDVLAVGGILHTLEAKVEIDLCAHKLSNVNVRLNRARLFRPRELRALPCGREPR